MKKVAIIISSAPHSTAKGREALDTALALSTFNHISVFFIGDGVFHLLANQHPEELYDIEDVYVCKASLDERKLSQTPLNIANQVIDKNQLTQLLANQDVILRF